jgi:hypothetical protein
MGIGGIFLAFGTTIWIISFFAHQGEWRIWLPSMMSVGTGSLVLGGVMFVLGWLLSRTGRSTARAEA